MQQRFIVAEIRKNWPEEEPGPGLAERFEDVVNRNRERGYVLCDWRLERFSPEPGLLNETIVAVFYWAGCGDAPEVEE